MVIARGAVELGTLQQGVVREVLEETGLVVVPAGIIEVLDRITQDEVLQDGATGRVRYHYVLIDFVCRVTGGALREGSDADEVRWVAREELAEYRLAPVTVRVIEKAFSLESGSVNTEGS